MPAAGDEGYEKLVQCPYDKSHEIRRGRLQFHLDKCRKNFPNSLMIKCPFNSTHLIPKVEEQFHTQEECMSRSNWDSHTHEVGDTNCPVKNLVPVTAGTIPEGDENWDDYETTGSVINTIRAQAEEKTILRMMQCESKAKRKNFRLNERRRIEALRNNPLTNDISENVSVTSDNEPLRRPTRKPYIPVERQDPAAAIAAIDSKYSNKHVIEQFRTLDLDVKKSNYNYMHTETSSMCNGPPSEPSVSGEVNFGATPMNYAAAFKSSSSTPRPASQPATSTAMSSAMSSNVSRPSTAMSVATSAGQVAITEQYIKLASSQEGFCQIPIPGLGRGSARQKVQDKSRKGRPSIAMSIALSAQEGTSAPFLGGANHEQFREMPTSGLGEGSTV